MPYSIILASCKFDFRLVCSQVFDKFVRVRDMLSTRFRLFLSKKNGREPAASIPTCRAATFYYSSQLQTWLKTWFLTRFSTSSCGFATCFRHAFDLLATCFRHAHASRKPGLQPGLQLARIMECSLNTVDLYAAKPDIRPESRIFAYSTCI